ncbi:serine/threonine protein kinase [Actibacterium pelagium]|nr:serine/threonine-protein kinase [Actibacterium pelagium]
MDELPGSEDALAPGTKLLGGVYTIDRFLKSGGFGITYIAHDSLGRHVVIKECFPGAICARHNHSVVVRSRHSLGELAKVVNCFKLEVRALSRIAHKNIVKVHDVFDENDTAYMAMDLISGPDLLDVIDDRVEVLTPERVMDMLEQLLGALTHIHGMGMLHRDISPDNILLDDQGDPVLIDFGAAREESARKSRALSGLQIVKDGYSPQELYIKGAENAPTIDIYALGATFYHVITGDVPPDGNSRLLKIAEGQADPYESLIGRAPGYPDEFLRAVDKALRVLPRDRFQSAEEWRLFLDGKISNQGAEAAISTLMTWLDENPNTRVKTEPLPKREISKRPEFEKPKKITRQSYDESLLVDEETERRITSKTLRIIRSVISRPLGLEETRESDWLEDTVVEDGPQGLSVEYRIRRAAFWVIGLSLAVGAFHWPF